MKKAAVTGLWAAALAAASVLPFSKGVNLSRRTTQSSPALQLAVAANIAPSFTSNWTNLIGYDSNTVSLLVANPDSGPGTSVDEEWLSMINAAHSSGKTVLGYVATQYLGATGLPTRLGSIKVEDWIAQIEGDVDLWYTLYGATSIGGIFFDVGYNQCGANNVYSSTYTYISQYVKSKYAGAYTVLNPGTALPQCYEDAADTLLTFENTYANYSDSNFYVASSWAPSDSSKIWHLLYDTPQNQIQAAVALAASRGVGLLGITSLTLPNPYECLPSPSYENALIGAVANSSSLMAVNIVPDAPRSLALLSVGNTSVGLSWTAATGAQGYNVISEYSMTVAVSLPAAFTDVVVVDLTPNTTYWFEVEAIGANGSTGPPSNTILAKTLAS